MLDPPLASAFISFVAVSRIEEAPEDVTLQLPVTKE
jgi:hypothetical protein